MLPIISLQLYGLDLHAALFIPLNILSLGIGLIIVYNTILFKSVVDTRTSLHTYESYPNNKSYISDAVAWIESRNALYSKHTLMPQETDRWLHASHLWNCNGTNMMTSSNGNIFRVTGQLCGEFNGEFLAQRTVTRSFDIFIVLHLNKRLSKESWSCWFETPSITLWHHCKEKD